MCIEAIYSFNKTRALFFLARLVRKMYLRNNEKCEAHKHAALHFLTVFELRLTFFNPPSHALHYTTGVLAVAAFEQVGDLGIDVGRDFSDEIFGGRAEFLDL